jgi:RHS repeat-associated core domain
MRDRNIIHWLWLGLVICLLDAAPAHAFYNPQQGRWLSRDPIEEYAGDNIYEFVLNRPTSVIDVFGLGTWVVTARDVSEYFGAKATVNAASLGYTVTYIPSSGECPRSDMRDGKVVLYQTVTAPGPNDNSPQVDNTPPPHKAPNTGCPLPPAMPVTPDQQNTYYDSPTYGLPDTSGNGKGRESGTWKITAVAVCKSECKQKKLSTYYFEWDNRDRKVTATNPNDTKQYDSAMHNYYNGE